MSLAVKLVLAPVLVAQALRTRATLPRLPEAAGEGGEDFANVQDLLREVVKSERDKAKARIELAKSSPERAEQELALETYRTMVRRAWPYND